MIRKGLAVAVILLFIGMSVVPSTAIQELKEKPSPISFDGNTLYVGGSGPNNYTTIQSAIDNASEGDTIIVMNGTYQQNIIVDKPLTIRSEYGYANCTIKAVDIADAILKIINHSVTIKGFNIDGRNLEYVEDVDEVIMLQYANNCSIIGNYLHDGNKCIKIVDSNNNSFYDNLIGRKWGLHYSGFWFERADNNIVRNNTIRHSFVEGIYFSDSDNNQFNNNIIDDCLFAFYGKSSENNYISDNIIKNSKNCINLFSSNSNTVENNTISVVEIFGKGIVLRNSNYNIIKNHIFNRNGISLENSFHNIIENISIGGKPLVYMEDESNKLITDSAGQIILINCDNVTIENQNISDIEIGIDLWSTSNSIISNNRISSKTYNGQGIRVRNGKNNLIFDNYLTENSPGILISSSDRNQIYSNMFHDNNQGIHGSIKLDNSYYNNIFNNTITNNEFGIRFSKSCNNNIYNNQIVENYEGIYLYGYSDNNNINHNFFNACNTGVKLYEVYRNNIFHNNFFNNEYGIELVAARENDITYNNFVNNNEYGVILEDSVSNRINYNNFLQSSVVFDIQVLAIGFNPFILNNWNYNFWNISRTSPKIIWGVGFHIPILVFPYSDFYIPIPWWDFDWHPAQEPYDIGV